MSSIGKDLRKILPARRVLDLPEDLSAYANDATFYIAKHSPDAVVMPENTDEVSAIIRYASVNRIPVVPRGAGSGLAGGCTPVQGGIVLDMKRMNAIIEIDDKNMSATVECGVVLDKFNRALAKQRLFYPPDPQSMSVCTIGGNVATRAGGPRGVKYGTTERYVTGLEAVMPDGSVINPGGKIMKQSSGYDITHLLTGSEGTLGVITRAHLRILPAPATKKTALITCSTVDQAAEVVSAIIARGAIPSMLEFLPKLAVTVLNNYLDSKVEILGEAYLLMEFDGSLSQVDQDAGDVKRICMDMGAIEARIITDEHESTTYWWGRSRIYPGMLQIFKRVITEDITVPRNSIPEFVRRVQAIAASCGVLIGIAGHAGDGNMHPTIMQGEISPEISAKAEKAIEEIVRAGLDLKGTISGEHGIGIHKSRFLELEHGAAEIAVMKKIKAALDPLNIMNPGKLWIEEVR